MREGKGRDGKRWEEMGWEGKGKDGIGREKKGKERKGWQGNGRDGKGWEWHYNFLFFTYVFLHSCIDRCTESYKNISRALAWSTTPFLKRMVIIVLLLIILSTSFCYGPSCQTCRKWRFSCGSVATKT